MTEQERRRVECFLRRHGMPEDFVQAILGGAELRILGDDLMGWLLKAYAAGEQAARGDVMAAEKRADDALERLRRLREIENRHATFQATVADALLWFDGYSAAFAMREPYERPQVPHRESLRALNAALQAIDRTPDDFDDPIPF